MRICFFISSMSRGGAERVAALLCNSLVARGHEVDLIVTATKHHPRRYKLDEKINLICLVDEVRHSTSMLKRLIAVRRIVKERDPDVIVSFLTRVNIGVLLATIGVSAPVIVSERNFPFKDEPDSLAVKYLRKISYKFACFTVSQTSDAANWIESECPGVKTHIVPNPIVYPLPMSEPIIHPDDVVSADRRTILAVNRLAPQKRTAIIIEAFSKIANKYDGWDLAILGEGEELKALREVATSLGLKSRVHFVGDVGNVDSWLSRAGIFAMASAYEGFPNALLEAVSYGLPSVVFDIKAGVREISNHGERAVLLPNDDHVNRMANAFISLIDDAGLYQKIRKSSYDIREEFGEAKIVDRWETLMQMATQSKQK